MLSAGSSPSSVSQSFAIERLDPKLSLPIAKILHTGYVMKTNSPRVFGACPSESIRQNVYARLLTAAWGDDEGPVVMVWDGILPEEQEIAKKVIREENDWIIW